MDAKLKHLEFIQDVITRMNSNSFLLKGWCVTLMSVLFALSARDTGNLGLTDEEQLIYAGKEKATIFTHDTDFLPIVARWVDEGKTHQGIIYCHQKSYSTGECIRKLRLLTAVLSSDDMVNHIEFL